MIIISDCYPNGTIEVYNHNPSVFTNVVAVLYEGSSSAEDCSTTFDGSSVIIDGCSTWVSTVEPAYVAAIKRSLI